MTAHNPEFRPLSWEDVQQPYIDGEFVVEEEPHIHDRPEWQVWRYFGEHKFAEATQRLRYTGTDGGLYHYQDLRDHTRYSVPVIDRVKEHFKEKRRADVLNSGARANWKIIWGAWAATLVALFIAGMNSDPTHHHELANVIGMTMIIIFIVGGVVLATAQSAMKHRARSLPSHHMFYTDAEITERERQQQQKDILIAGATAAYLAHKYHQHSQEHLADLIAEKQRGYSSGPSQWHH